MTTPELVSQQIIQEIDRMKVRVKESIQRTDALLDQLGLTREMLRPLAEKIKRSLPEADRLKLAQLEAEWQRELEQATLSANARKDPAAALSKRIRVELLNRI